MRNIVVPVLAAVAIVFGTIIVTQTVRFNCIDLGFYKSCGVSTVR